MNMSMLTFFKTLPKEGSVYKRNRKGNDWKLSMSSGTSLKVMLLRTPKVFLMHIFS